MEIQQGCSEKQLNGPSYYTFFSSGNQTIGNIYAKYSYAIKQL
jgi:hypothetical protein